MKMSPEQLDLAKKIYVAHVATNPNVIDEVLAMAAFEAVAAFDQVKDFWEAGERRKFTGQTGVETDFAFTERVRVWAKGVRTAGGKSESGAETPHSKACGADGTRGTIHP